ncbi:hypothetical protein MBAV_005836, partial [Candidatus Magnetobacterium bavaricum]
EYAGNEDIRPLSLYKLFELYKGAGKPDKAVETLKQLEKLRTPIYKDIVLYHMAEILKKQGKDDESKKKMQELEKNYPNSPYLPPKPTQGDNSQAVQSIPITIPASGTKPSGQSAPPAGEKPTAAAPLQAAPLTAAPAKAAPDSPPMNPANAPTEKSAK